MIFPDSLPSDRQSALALLMSRFSSRPLILPEPSEDELTLAFAAAVRAPSRCSLRPWRFVVVRHAERNAFYEALLHNATAMAMSAEAERLYKIVHTAPMLIGLGARIIFHRRVPEDQQMLPAGAAIMNLFNALHLMGFGGFWIGASPERLQIIHKTLRFEEDVRSIGVLCVGTPEANAKMPTRPDGTQFVRNWQP